MLSLHLRAVREQNREQNRTKTFCPWFLGINSRLVDLEFFFLGINSRLVDLENFLGVRRDPDFIISNRCVPSVPGVPSVPSKLVNFHQLKKTRVICNKSIQFFFHFPIFNSRHNVTTAKRDLCIYHASSMRRTNF